MLGTLYIWIWGLLTIPQSSAVPSAHRSLTYLTWGSCLLWPLHAHGALFSTQYTTCSAGWLDFHSLDILPKLFSDLPFLESVKVFVIDYTIFEDTSSSYILLSLRAQFQFKPNIFAYCSFAKILVYNYFDNASSSRVTSYIFLYPYPLSRALSYVCGRQ